MKPRDALIAAAVILGLLLACIFAVWLVTRMLRPGGKSDGGHAQPESGIRPR